MGATAGDLIAKDVACTWLRKAGIEPTVAAIEPLRRPEEIPTSQVAPEDYDTLVFVCGPIGNGPPLNEFLDRFPHAASSRLM